MASKPVALLSGRPWGDQEPLASSLLQRQPLLGGPLQDAEVPVPVPRAFRLDRGRTDLLSAVLPLVEPASPPLRDRLPHAGRRPPGAGRHASAGRGRMLTEAYAAHPERFVRKPPQPPTIPEVAWINQPETNQENPQDTSILTSGRLVGVDKFRLTSSAWTLEIKPSPILGLSDPLDYCRNVHAVRALPETSTRACSRSLTGPPTRPRRSARWREADVFPCFECAVNCNVNAPFGGSSGVGRRAPRDRNTTLR